MINIINPKNKQPVDIQTLFLYLACHVELYGRQRRWLYSTNALSDFNKLLIPVSKKAFLNDQVLIILNRPKNL